MSLGGPLLDKGSVIEKGSVTEKSSVPEKMDKLKGKEYESLKARDIKLDVARAARKQLLTDLLFFS
jgi:hypothetical protein